MTKIEEVVMMIIGIDSNIVHCYWYSTFCSSGYVTDMIVINDGIQWPQWPEMILIVLEELQWRNTNE